jgi:hypothetical protein
MFTWVHLYQWKDAIDVKGGADTKVWELLDNNQHPLLVATGPREKVLLQCFGPNECFTKMTFLVDDFNLKSSGLYLESILQNFSYQYCRPVLSL